jgi:hypothetical protein
MCSFSLRTALFFCCIKWIPPSFRNAVVAANQQSIFNLSNRDIVTPHTEWVIMNKVSQDEKPKWNVKWKIANSTLCQTTGVSVNSRIAPATLTQNPFIQSGTTGMGYHQDLSMETVRHQKCQTFLVTPKRNQHFTSIQALDIGSLLSPAKTEASPRLFAFVHRRGRLTGGTSRYMGLVAVDLV